MINISEAFDEFRERIGISINQIRHTINKADKVTNINLNRLQKQLLGYVKGKTLVVSIFLKHYSKAGEDYHILVVAHKISSRDTYVVGAYKVTTQIIPELNVMNPVEVLRNFVEIFGVEQSIAGRTRRFFYGEIIEQQLGLVHPLAAPVLQAKESHKVLQTNYIKIDSITNRVFCGLSYCIDYTEYLKWLDISML